MTGSTRVHILEVGPRDGFQNVKVDVPTAEKIRIVDLLTEADLKRIEVSSFVNPKLIPRLRDAAEVFAGIQRRPSVSYSALIPNEKGLDRAIESKVDEVVYVISASDSVSRKVFNKGTEEALALIPGLAEKAKTSNVKLRGIIACAFGSLVEGEVTPQGVVDVARELEQAGCFEVSLADTFGIASPGHAGTLLSEFVGQMPHTPVSVHFHDTKGIGLANVYAAWEAGITTFEGSVAGLGGDPLTPEAPGNVATERMVNMFHRMGVDTGVDLDKLEDCARSVRDMLTALASPHLSGP
jgi:hydroxymethylglutaryl-CoA lyase